MAKRQDNYQNNYDTRPKGGYQIHRSMKAQHEKRKEEIKEEILLMDISEDLNNLEKSLIKD